MSLLSESNYSHVAIATSESRFAHGLVFFFLLDIIVGRSRL